MFAIVINQHSSPIDSTIYKIVLDTSDNSISHIYPAQQHNTKTLLQKSVQEHSILLYKKDMLLFQTYAEANQFLSSFLPYIGSFIHTNKKTPLREASSVNAVLTAYAPNNTSLYVISSPYFHYNEDTLFSPLPETKLFTKAVELWIKVRYIHDSTYTDAWTLVTHTTALQYKQENPLSSTSVFSDISKEGIIWKSQKNIIADTNTATIIPSTIMNTGLFINMDNVPYPHLSLQTHQQTYSTERYAYTTPSHSSSASSISNIQATTIALSQILPYTKNIFLVPSKNMQISILPSKEITIHYPDASNERYYPFSSHALQMLQAKNSANTLRVENTLSRYATWSSALYGKIHLSLQQNPRAVFIDWKIPLPLRSQYAIHTTRSLQSVIITNTIPDTSLSVQTERVIALIHPNKSQYIFFALTILSETKFTLQHIIPTIPHEEDSLSTAPHSPSLVDYTKEFGTVLRVQGTLSGPIMTFKAIQ